MNNFNSLTYQYPIITHTFLVMSILFLPVVILLILNLKYILRIFRVIDKKVLLLLLAIFLIGFWLRNSEYRYGMDVDGVFYQEMAKNIYENNLFVQGCAVGNNTHCRYYYESVVLPGYPYLISLLFHFFGVHDIFSMVISGVFGSLNIILIFLIFYLLFSNAEGALLASAIFAFLPLDIYICSTAAVRPTAIFFMCMTIVLYLLSLKEKKLSLWIGTVLVLSFTIYIRLEFYLCIIPMVIYMIMKKEEINKKVFIYFLIAVFIFLIHQICAIDWLLNRNFGMTGGRYRTFSLEYFPSYFPQIISYFFIRKFNIGYLFNPIISLIFTGGILSLFINKKERKELFFIIILFFIFLIGIVLFYHGAAGEETIRYLQPLGIPYCILASFMWSWIFKKIGKNKVHFINLFLVATILIPFAWVFLKFNFFADKRKDEKLVSDYFQIYNKIPAHSLVLTTQAQVFNFDFMRGKDIEVVTYGQNQLEEYIGYSTVFIEELEQSKELNWFFIPMNCEQNKLCMVIDGCETVRIYGTGNLELYEVLDKTCVVEKIENWLYK